MITSSHKIVLNIITRYRNIFLIKQQKSEDFWEYDKKDIKTYLDTDRKLTDAREPYEDKLDSDEKLSKKKEQKFNHIVDLQERNLKNFANYINNNQMPNKEYEQYTKKISNYMIAIYQTNQHALNLDEDASLKDILDVNKDKNIANGREQAKIEKFLKEKNIQTIAFDK